MDVKTFNQNYELDTTAKRGIKARRKNGAKELPEALTGDGETYCPEQRYFFFDQSGREVRQTMGLRRVDNEWIGSFGLKVAKISELRTNRAGALGDGVKFFQSQITELQEKISDFETEKSAENIA